RRLLAARGLDERDDLAGLLLAAERGDAAQDDLGALLRAGLAADGERDLESLRLAEGGLRLGRGDGRRGGLVASLRAVGLHLGRRGCSLVASLLGGRLGGRGLVAGLRLGGDGGEDGLSRRLLAARGLDERDDLASLLLATERGDAAQDDLGALLRAGLAADGERDLESLRLAEGGLRLGRGDRRRGGLVASLGAASARDRVRLTGELADRSEESMAHADHPSEL